MRRGPRLHPPLSYPAPTPLLSLSYPSPIPLLPLSYPTPTPILSLPYPYPTPLLPLIPLLLLSLSYPSPTHVLISMLILTRREAEGGEEEALHVRDGDLASTHPLLPLSYPCFDLHVGSLSQRSWRSRRGSSPCTRWGPRLHPPSPTLSYPSPTHVLISMLVLSRRGAGGAEEEALHV